MKYIYKRLEIESYLTSLYKDGFKQSIEYSDDDIKNILLNIGIFKFKGYVKAFRQDVSNFFITDIIKLYNTDRIISLKMFELSSKIEVKLKASLIETIYELTDNPFFYLLKDSYIEDFTINNESIYDWEVKQTNPKQKKEIYLHYRDYYLANYDFESNKQEYLLNKTLIELNQKLDINYPPFHYFVENITLGSLINMISKLTLNNESILKLLANKFNMYDSNVFLTYLLRLKEIRNRCAHNGRLFNRNYRGVKAYGKHKTFRKTIYEHKLIDVYYSLHLLLGENDFKTVDELTENFKSDIFSNCEENIKNFVVNIMKTR